MGGRLSTKGDVYSFGVLLLEMFTRKRPTDELFVDDLNLVKFVKFALPDRVLEIVEKSLLIDDVGKLNDSCWTNESEQTRCLTLIFQIGVKCCEESPGDRMNMREAVMKLLLAKDKLLRTGIHEEK